MGTGRRVFSWAPAWLWLFWLASAVFIAAGLWRGGEPEPRFLVATGQTLEIWHGSERESTLLKFDDGSQIFEAAPSPDGTRIAFVTLTSPHELAKGDIGVDLYVAGRDGANPRVILRHSVSGEYIESLTWLPGGDALAYAIATPLSDESIDRRIEAIDVTSGQRRRLLPDADTVASLPGGRHLVINVTEFKNDLPRERPILYDLETGKVSDFPGLSLSLVYIGSFAPSPDGRQIAFGGADPSVQAPRQSPLRSMAVRAVTHPVLQDVWIMDVDGANLRRVTELAANQPSIVWSADGEYLYAMASIGFWRIDPRTGASRQIGPGLPTGRIKLLPGR